MKEKRHKRCREEFKEVLHCSYYVLEHPSEFSKTETTFRVWREKIKTKKHVLIQTN